MCDVCEHIFVDAQAIRIEGEATGISIDMPVSDCPQCGGSARIVRGTWDHTTDGVLVLRRALEPRQLRALARKLASRSRAEIVDLQDRLRDAQTRHDDTAAVRTLSELGVVDASALKRRLGTHEQRTEVYAIVSLILTVIAVAVAMLDRGESLSEQDITRILQLQQEGAPPPNQTTDRRLTDLPRSTYPPNEPCPCGSGKKWKRCHGAHPQLRAQDEGPT